MQSILSGRGFVLKLGSYSCWIPKAMWHSLYVASGCGSSVLPCFGEEGDRDMQELQTGTQQEPGRPHNTLRVTFDENTAAPKISMPYLSFYHSLSLSLSISLSLSLSPVLSLSISLSLPFYFSLSLS